MTLKQCYRSFLGLNSLIIKYLYPKHELLGNALGVKELIDKKTVISCVMKILMHEIKSHQTCEQADIGTEWEQWCLQLLN